MGLYILKFGDTPKQILSWGFMGEIVIVTEKICFYFLERYPEFNFSLFIFIH